MLVISQQHLAPTSQQPYEGCLQSPVKILKATVSILTIPATGNEDIEHRVVQAHKAE